MCIATAGTFGAMGPFWTLPPALLSRHSVAAGIALLTSIGGLGNFVSPPIIGWISAETGSLASGQIYFGVLLLLGGVALLAALPARTAVSGQTSIEKSPIAEAPSSTTHR